MLAYVNQVGAQDELLFDGGSLVVGADGAVLSRAPQFEQTLLLTDLELPSPREGRTGPVNALDGTFMTIERTLISEQPLAPYPGVPSPVAEHLDVPAEVYAALVLATHDYVEKNSFRTVVLGLSGGVESALVATIAADALGPSGSSPSACRAAGPAATRSTTPANLLHAKASHTPLFSSNPWSRPIRARSRSWAARTV